MSSRRAWDTRRPPMPPRPGKMGICTWCGKTIFFPADHKKAGEVNLRRSWHPDCIAAYKLATESSWQRDACFKRDKGRCAGCATMARRPGWERLGEWHCLAYDVPGRDFSIRTSPAELAKQKAYGSGLATLIRWGWVDDWHADHIRPLWSAPADLPLGERDAWWGIVNLQTLCHDCHKAKTKREAADRAAHRRLAAAGPLLQGTVR